MFGAAIVFVILFHAALFGGRLLRRPNGVASFLVATLFILAVQSVAQTAFYYAGWTLGSLTDLFSLAVAVIPLHTFWFLKETPEEPETKKIEPKEIAWMVALGLASLIACFYAIKASAGVATDQSIRTPWPLLPVGALAACAIPALAAWIAAWKTKSRVFVAALSALAVLSVTLITPLVYSVGFGFDGFLHRASESILLKSGTLSPKPPYYIGQYVFVTWLSRLTHIDVSVLDRFLVPIAAAILPFFFLPLAKDRRAMPVAALLFLPLSAFVVTTPQAFAYLVGCLALLSALGSANNRWHPAVALALSAWALAIHPLAGLPLALGAIAILLASFKQIPVQALGWIAALAAAVSVPAAFALLNTSQASVSWNIANLWNAQTLGAFFSALMPPQNRVALWADWASMVAFLLPVAMTFSAGVAIWKDRERRRFWTLLSALAVGMVLAGLFLKAAGEFAFLIEYERGNYADRLFVLAVFFLLAPAACGASFLLERFEKAGASAIAALLIGLFAWHGAQAYDALPRFDASVTNHGWSASLSDIQAVRWIDRDAEQQPYTVLANQSVSAVAVQELGFKRYAGDVFFYPIPTGGKLYQVFLDAVEDHSTTDTIREAGQLGQSKLVYVVLNDYWWDAQAVGDHLAGMADAEQDFGTSTDRVFKFVLP
jgi:hypothetical protein